MRRDGENGNLVFAGAVDPENPPCGRGLVFRVGFENFFSVRAFDGDELMSVETGMAGIGFEQAQCLSHGLESFRQSVIGLKGVQLARCPFGEE